MDQINVERTCVILNQILEYELAGVVRYTHYGLMIVGPYRQPIIDFMNGQASESLLHAQQAGEIITGLGGHPSQRIASIEETNNHDVKPILQESLEHEMNALNLYRSLLEEVTGKSVYLEEYARNMIGTEELHTLDLKKMLRDFSVPHLQGKM